MSPCTLLPRWAPVAADRTTRWQALESADIPPKFDRKQQAALVARMRIPLSEECVCGSR